MIKSENIIEKIPVRFITIFLFIIILLWLLVLGGILLIKKPSVVKGKITLVTDSQPVILVAPSIGKLKLLFKEDKLDVSENQILAYIENTANIDIVIQLDSILRNTSIENLSSQLADNLFSNNLGELTYSFLKLKEALHKLKEVQDHTIVKLEKEQLSQDLISLKSTLKEKNEVQKIQVQKIQMVKEQFETDSILYTEQAILKNEFNNTQSLYLNQQSQLLQLKADIISLKQQIKDTEYKLLKTEEQNENNTEEVILLTNNSLNNLKTEILKWGEAYLIRSPQSGKLELSHFIESDHFVNKGTEVMRILPSQNGIRGLVYYTSLGAGDVYDGAPLKIYLDNYPKFENGYLSGTIEKLSSSSYTDQEGNSFYSGQINIDINQQPNFSGNYEFTHNMTGVADIIVKERPLFFEIFGWLNEVFN